MQGTYSSWQLTEDTPPNIFFFEDALIYFLRQRIRTILMNKVKKVMDRVSRQLSLSSVFCFCFCFFFWIIYLFFDFIFQLVGCICSSEFVLAGVI